jgi:hypothetical protein
MARDPYSDADEPAGEPKKGGLALGKNVGPLPVWGWAVVAVAGVFLYRKIAGGGAANSTTAAAATSPTLPNIPANGAPPQVFLVNQGTGTSAVPTTPGSSVATPITPAAPAYLTTGVGTAPPGQTCAPGLTLVQGPGGFTCETADQAIQLGKYLAAIGPK